ncbi:hypothetical protein M0802_000793 [Mischocyttarus mexicanus]|nr:hypothetical protein M0802_000793 [Mischocyttarus mexicanus]
MKEEEEEEEKEEEDNDDDDISILHNGRKGSGTSGRNGAGSGAGSGGGEYLRELAVSLIPSINVSWGGKSSVYPEQILVCSALEQHRAQ